MTKMIRIVDIDVSDRIPRDMGDIESLANSIRCRGLLHFPVITTTGRLVAGARRLAALMSMDETEVECHVVDNLDDARDLLLADTEENTCRKDMSPSEAVVRAAKLEEILGPPAAKRQEASRAKPGEKVGSKQVQGETNLGSPSVAKEPQILKQIAPLVGMKPETLRKAINVVKHGTADDRAKMDRTGKVDEAHRNTEVKRRRERRAEAVAAVTSAPPVVVGNEYRSGEIYVADIHDLHLPAESIGMIFTDPPYHDEHIELYAELGRVAMESLRPGGYLMAYCGNMFLPEVLDALRGVGLTYIWQMIVFHPFSKTKINKYHLFQNHRPIVLFRKDTGPLREWVQDVVRGERNKEDHDWQQDQDAPRQYIPIYADPEDVVLDPFVGGGTTIDICRELGQPFLGFDIDPDNVQLVRVKGGA